jgi:hypothetical protein
MSGNPQEVTAGVGVGVGVGVGGGVTPAASPPPAAPDLLSQSDITPTGANVNTNDTSPPGTAERFGWPRDPLGAVFNANDTSPEPVAKIAKRQQAKRIPETLCPETLSDAQWREVRAWRDKKHPAIGDPQLKAEWDAHANWHIGKGNLRRVWVRSFYMWVTKSIEQRGTATTSTDRPPPPVWKAPQGPKFSDADPEAIAKALEESRASRKKRKPTPEPKAPQGEDGVPF